MSDSGTVHNPSCSREKLLQNILEFLWLKRTQIQPAAQEKWICEWAPPKRIRGQRAEGNERRGWHLPGNTSPATLWGKSRNKFLIAQKRTRNVFLWVFFIKYHLWVRSQWAFYCFCIFRGLKCSKSLLFFSLGQKKKKCSFRRNMEIKVPGSMPSLAGNMIAPEEGFCSKVQEQNLQLLPHPGHIFSDQTWRDGTSKIKSTNKTINWEKSPSKYFQMQWGNNVSPLLLHFYSPGNAVPCNLALHWAHKENSYSGPFLCIRMSMVSLSPTGTGIHRCKNLG